MISVKETISDCLDKVGLAHIFETNSSTTNSFERYRMHLNKYTPRKKYFLIQSAEFHLI